MSGINAALNLEMAISSAAAISTLKSISDTVDSIQEKLASIGTTTSKALNIPITDPINIDAANYDKLNLSIGDVTTKIKDATSKVDKFREAYVLWASIAKDTVIPDFGSLNINDMTTAVYALKELLPLVKDKELLKTATAAFNIPPETLINLRNLIFYEAELNDVMGDVKNISKRANELKNLSDIITKYTEDNALSVSKLKNAPIGEVEQFGAALNDIKRITSDGDLFESYIKSLNLSGEEAEAAKRHYYGLAYTARIVDEEFKKFDKTQYNSLAIHKQLAKTMADVTGVGSDVRDMVASLANSTAVTMAAIQFLGNVLATAAKQLDIFSKANARAAGSASQLLFSVSSMQSSLSAASDEALKATLAIVGAGIRMGQGFQSAVEQAHKLSEAYGVDVEATASFLKVMMSVGKTMDDAIIQTEVLAAAVRASGATTAEANMIFRDATQQAGILFSAYKDGGKMVGEYNKALAAMTVLAKDAKVELDIIVKLMKDVALGGTKMVLLLGGKAFDRASTPLDRMATAIKRVAQVMDMDLNPALKPQVVEALTGRTFEEADALYRMSIEAKKAGLSVEDYLEKVNNQKNATQSFNETLQTLTGSLKQVINPILGLLATTMIPLLKILYVLLTPLRLVGKIFQTVGSIIESVSSTIGDLLDSIGPRAKDVALFGVAMLGVVAAVKMFNLTAKQGLLGILMGIYYAIEQANLPDWVTKLSASILGLAAAAAVLSRNFNFPTNVSAMKKFMAVMFDGFKNLFKLRSTMKSGGGKSIFENVKDLFKAKPKVDPTTTADKIADGAKKTRDIPSGLGIRNYLKNLGMGLHLFAKSITIGDILKIGLALTVMAGSMYLFAKVLNSITADATAIFGFGVLMLSTMLLLKVAAGIATASAPELIIAGIALGLFGVGLIAVAYAFKIFTNALKDFVKIGFGKLAASMVTFAGATVVLAGASVLFLAAMIPMAAALLMLSGAVAIFPNNDFHRLSVDMVTFASGLNSLPTNAADKISALYEAVRKADKLEDIVDNYTALANALLQVASAVNSINSDKLNLLNGIPVSAGIPTKTNVAVTNRTESNDKEIALLKEISSDIKSIKDNSGTSAVGAITDILKTYLPKIARDKSTLVNSPANQWY